MLARAERRARKELKAAKDLSTLERTDGLRSYGVARCDLLPGVRHRTSRYSNNRAEQSDRPTRWRERQM